LFNILFFIIECASTALSIALKDVLNGMSVGVNLGKTFEIKKDWKTVENINQPWDKKSFTAKEIVESYKQLGFNAIRIPVNWATKINSKTIIEPNLLKSVEEIVHNTIDNNMFAIINLETSNSFMTGFISEDEELRSETYDGYKNIWKQVSNHFKDYDEHLLFESMNDSGYWEDIWNTRTTDGDRQAALDVLRQVNQEFINAVRSTGDNNEKRYLLVSGYANDPILTQDNFYKIPSDPSHKLLVSLYYYVPNHFTTIDNYYTWGSQEDVKQLQTIMKNLSIRFVIQGVPVIITRYGTIVKNRSSANINSYLTSIVNNASSQNMPSFLSDSGEFIDREHLPLSFINEELGKFYKKMGESFTPPEPSKPDEKDDKEDDKNDKDEKDEKDNNKDKETCFSEPDYPCCSKCDIEVAFNEGEHKLWGIENSNWCGIPESCSETSTKTTTSTTTKAATSTSPTNECWSLKLGYSCCKESTKVYTTDESGSWGVENGQWCGISK
jgi:endoglucanase